MSNNKKILDYYEEHKNIAYAYFLYRVNFDEEIAENLTADLFIKAIREFEDNSLNSFKLWLYSASKEILDDFLEKRDIEIEMDKTLLRKIHKNRIFVSMLEKIYDLDGYVRETVLLKFVDGLSALEISVVLNKRIEMINNCLSRATYIIGASEEYIHERAPMTC